MRLLNIKRLESLSWSEIITVAEIAAALLVLFIIVAEWLVTLNSLCNQATGK